MRFHVIIDRMEIVVDAAMFLLQLISQCCINIRVLLITIRVMARDGWLIVSLVRHVQFVPSFAIVQIVVDILHSIPFWILICRPLSRLNVGY